ncbi:MAG: hypothetical protein CSA07_04750 [Bacteroidia bacterium]|nr:MAG: hypothetical protein CSA07_04750 [Bacteroidia bacterium]
MSVWIIIVAILVGCVPGLLVLVVAIYTMRGMRESQAQQSRIHEAIEMRKVTLPVRLQAIERLALLLERISPEALMLRTPTEDMNVQQYEARLLATVREEFNHNLSQQVYVHDSTWGEIRQAKGNVSQFITLCAQKTHAEAPANELNKTMLMVLKELQAHPVAQALAMLRAEASQY